MVFCFINTDLSRAHLNGTYFRLLGIGLTFSGVPLNAE